MTEVSLNLGLPGDCQVMNVQPGPSHGNSVGVQKQADLCRYQKEQNFTEVWKTRAPVPQNTDGFDALSSHTKTTLFCQTLLFQVRAINRVRSALYKESASHLP